MIWFGCQGVFFKRHHAWSTWVYEPRGKIINEKETAYVAESYHNHRTCESCGLKESKRGTDHYKGYHLEIPKQPPLKDKSVKDLLEDANKGFE